MKAKMKRFMVSITPDLEQDLDELKKERFYNKPYSEVYRYVLAQGLKAVATQKKAETKNKVAEQ